MLFLACWVSSFVFVNIIYALTASFGDVGKAIGVVLMVIQVAGSGGTFPRRCCPGLPGNVSVPAVRSRRERDARRDVWPLRQRLLDLPKPLLTYLVPALLLGLVLRRPIIRLNEWIEEKLESTKIM